MSPEETEARYIAGLRKQLIACGVPADSIAVRYKDFICSHEATISCGPLTADQVACIASAAHGSCHIEFTDVQNRDQLRRWEHQTYTGALREQADMMPDVPRYDPATITLEAFAREVEEYAGVEPGAALEVRDGRLLMTAPTLPLEPGGLQRHGRLIQALSVGLLDHPELMPGIVGGGG